MKRIIAIAALAAVAFTGLPAAAQNAVSGSASQANNTANQISASGAIASGGSTTGTVIYNEAPVPSTITNKQDGTATLKTAPALGGLSVGGGHPCAWTPGSGQISIIGGGFGAAGMTIDEACMLAIMGGTTGDARMYNAALYMMAARDPLACEAMYTAGIVSDCKKNGKSIIRDRKRTTFSGGADAGAGTGATTFSSRNAAEPVKVLYSKCDFDSASNKVTFKKKYGADSSAAKAQCMASLGF